MDDRDRSPNPDADTSVPHGAPCPSCPPGAHGAPSPSSAPVDDPARRAGELASELSRLALTDLEGLSPEDLVNLADHYQHLHSAVVAARSAALAACEEARVHAEVGLRRPTGWWCDRHRLPFGVAAGQVALSRGLLHVPRVRAALAAGEISESHARDLARLWTPKVAEVLERDLHLLLDAARRHSYQGFREVLRRWLALADPERSDRADQRDRKARALYLSRVGDRVRIDGDVDTLSGVVMDNALRHFEQKLFDEDWKATRDRYGDDACAELLPRSPAQRRLDAMVLALETAYQNDTGGTGDPLVNVVIDHKTLDHEIRRFCGLPHDGSFSFDPDGRCSLIDGTPISPALALHLAFRGHMARVVLNNEGRIIDMGRRSRFFSGALREALIIRDRTCCHPGCNLPATRCEADHRIPWSEGGSTDLDNGQMLCFWHHRLKHLTTPTRAA